jgi:heptaprenyl diphosphate synthase
MLLMKKVPGISIVGVSVSGAVAHNMAQIATASLVVRSMALVGYLPALLIAAVITGVLTGVAAKYALPACVSRKAAGSPEKYRG